jgi:hypothetical protein
MKTFLIQRGFFCPYFEIPKHFGSIVYSASYIITSLLILFSLREIYSLFVFLSLNPCRDPCIYACDSMIAFSKIYVSL